VTTLFQGQVFSTKKKILSGIFGFLKSQARQKESEFEITASKKQVGNPVFSVNCRTVARDFAMGSLHLRRGASH